MARFVSTTSLASLGAAVLLAAPCAVQAKGAPSAMAYDTGGLLQSDANQPPSDTSAPQQPPAQTPTQGTLTATPAQTYGGNPYDTGVSYAGEVQTNDPSSTSIATQPTRANTARGGRNGAPDQTLDAEGTSDTTLAPSALIPGQVNVFGNEDLHGRKLVIRPYIEAQQTIYAPISPSGDVLTYSVLAAGVDGLVNGRNTQGAVSLRYQRNFGWGKANDSDAINGLANFTTRIAGEGGRSGKGGLSLDYGGYAQRVTSYTGGAAFGAINPQGDTLSQIYSVYAGPRYATQIGDVAVNAAYHAGYTKVDNSDGTGRIGGNLLDHSLSQDARLAASTRPGDGGLPVGLTGEAGYYRQDISNLDQRVEDFHARAGVIVPVTQNLNVIATAGYEKVQASSRDAVYDAQGNPVVDASGRYVTDPNSPRLMAFDTSGLIWDVGVQWRPNPRTSAEAHIGRRYGRLGGYGFFNWQPNGRTTFSVVAYENLTGFGGSLTSQLTAAPTSFVAVRDPVSGGLTGCVGSFSGGGCVTGSLGTLNGQIYRGRGVMASGMFDFGHWQAGLAGGWDRRQYLGAPGTVLELLNGKADQDYWGAIMVNGKLTQRSSLQTTLQLYRFESGLTSAGDTTGLSATALYNYYFTRHLTGNASAVINGVKTEQNVDIWSATGALGMRYTF